MSPDPDILDRQHLSRATGGDEALMRELLDMLRRELPARRRQLEDALAADDLESAARAAHKLQGAAAYTGATALERTAAMVEDILQGRREGDAAAARRDLENAIASLERTLGESNSLRP